MNNDRKNELSAKLFEARNAEETRALIAAGADPKVWDGRGDTPLHFSSIRGADAAEQMRVLLAAGADPNARNDRGETPLHRAESAEKVQALIAGGADPNARDNRGETPLHRAESESAEKAQVLREAMEVRVNPQPQAGPTRDDDSGYDY